MGCVVSKQFDRFDPKHLGKLVQRDNSWVALALLQPAYVLLAEPRKLLNLFLGQPDS